MKETEYVQKTLQQILHVCVFRFLKAFRQEHQALSSLLCVCVINIIEKTQFLECYNLSRCAII